MGVIAGTRLGPYEILSPLGAGGMGEVYRARDTRLDRTVAIKVLPADVASDAGRRQRFETEARAVAALSHPNIVAIHDVAFEDRTAFIVSELVPGETLRSVIQRGPAPLRRVLEIGAQIADGLAAAHAAGIAHRDLKPENVMLTPDGRVKILDFGLAKSVRSVEAAADATRTLAISEPGSIVGTASYMSPEQAAGDAQVDGRSDQFSLGLMLEELITGRKVFERPTAAETMAAIIREDAPPLPASVPAPVRWTIERCLAKERAQRYQSTRDLYLELRQLCDRSSEISAVVPAAVAASRRAPKWWRVPLVAAAAIVVGFAVALLWLQAPLAPALYVPFATEPGIQTMPAWSPDGERIAYSGEAGDKFQIFVRKLGAPAPTQITHQDASCFTPFWSPDGSRIYYIAWRSTLDQSLWSAAVAGGAPEKVLDDVVKAAISPDGKVLAVQSILPDKTHTVLLSSPPGAPARPLPDAAAFKMRGSDVFFSMQFTRDGKHLGIVSSGGNRSRLWKIPINGGAPEELPAGHDLPDVAPLLQWFHANSMIWSWTDEGNAHVMVRDLGRSADRDLTPGVFQARFAALSPDERTLALQAGFEGYHLTEIPLSGAAAASPVVTAHDEVAPSFSPDGVHFAYSTDRNGYSEIWLRNRLDGSERRVVNPRDFPQPMPAEMFLDCAISPDGSHVAYRRETGSGVRIWISSLAGDTPVPLYEDPNNEWQRGPSWSPDGNWIAYYGSHSGRPAVMKMRVGSSAPPPVVTYVAGPTPVRWSPRGDWLAWDDGGKLTLVSSDGARRRTLAEGEWLTYGWSKEGDAMLAISVSAGRHLTLVRLDIDPAHQVVIADLGPAPAGFQLAGFQQDFPYRGFSVSPDGKSFLTSALSLEGDIWLLENFDTRLGLMDRLLRR